MVSKKESKRLNGAMLILAGTAIGGGMMAQPIASASFGFFGSIIILGVLWALMSYTAFVTLEMNLYFKKGISISGASEAVFGLLGKTISTLTIGLLFYSLLSFYLAAGASIFKPILHSLFNWVIGDRSIILAFLGIFGSLIVMHAVMVDAANRILLSVKAIFFLIFFLALIPSVQPGLLAHLPSSSLQWSSLSFIIPMFFTSFGFHGSIPTLVDYLGVRPLLLKKAFFFGSLLPLLVYILWEGITLSVLPLEGPISFSAVQQNGNDVGFFAESLSLISQSSWVTLCCQMFIVTGLITAFLGVGIGLFDWVSEQITYKFKGIFKKALTAIGTFGIPVTFALFYPKGYLTALGFAAIFLSILAVIIPVLTVLILRKRNDPTEYRAPFGTIGLLIALVCGIGIILIEIKNILF